MALLWSKQKTYEKKWVISFFHPSWLLSAQHVLFVCRCGLNGFFCLFFIYLLFSCFAFLVYDCLPVTTASTTGLEPGKRQSKTTMPLGKWLCCLAKKHVWQVYKPRWSWSSLSPSALLQRCQVGTSAKLISWVASPGLGKLVQVEEIAAHTEPLPISWWAEPKFCLLPSQTKFGICLPSELNFHRHWEMYSWFLKIFLLHVCPSVLPWGWLFEHQPAFTLCTPIPEWCGLQASDRDLLPTGPQTDVSLWLCQEGVRKQGMWGCMWLAQAATCQCWRVCVVFMRKGTE